MLLTGAVSVITMTHEDHVNIVDECYNRHGDNDDDDDIIKSQQQVRLIDCYHVRITYHIQKEAKCVCCKSQPTSNCLTNTYFQRYVII